MNGGNPGPGLLGVAIASPLVFALNGLWLGLGCLVFTILLLLLVELWEP